MGHSAGSEGRPTPDCDGFGGGGGGGGGSAPLTARRSSAEVYHHSNAWWGWGEGRRVAGRGFKGQVLKSRPWPSSAERITNPAPDGEGDGGGSG